MLNKDFCYNSCNHINHEIVDWLSKSSVSPISTFSFSIADAVEINENELKLNNAHHIIMFLRWFRLFSYFYYPNNCRPY